MQLLPAFIAHYSEISHPLTQLCSAKTKFIETPECEVAFKELKERLMGASVLAYPDHG